MKRHTMMLIVCLAACGDDKAPAGDAAQTTADTSATNADVSASTDADDDASDTAVSCDRTGFVASYESFRRDQQDLQYRAETGSDAPYDLLVIELFARIGGVHGPGTYQLDSDNYETCATCVTMGSGCGSDESCAKRFFAAAGTITIPEGQGNDEFVGTLDNVVLVEVTIDVDNAYHSTPVVGGETWCVPHYVYNAQN